MSAAAEAGGPLALTALATSAGFLSFLRPPTRLSELGQIAGCGMLIAFVAASRCCRRCSRCSIRRAKTSAGFSAWRRSIVFSIGAACR